MKVKLKPLRPEQGDIVVHKNYPDGERYLVMVDREGISESNYYLLELSDCTYISGTNWDLDELAEYYMVVIQAHNAVINEE
jgi:hypothetical protein